MLSQKQLRGAMQYVGELLIVQQTDALLHRMLRVARLQYPDSASRPMRMLPDLLDCQILWMGNEGFTLSGFERLQGRTESYVAFAQSWWVRPLSR